MSANLGFDVPITCINKLCNRQGILVYGNREKCFECGEDMHLAHGRMMQSIAPVVNDTFTCPPDLTGCPIASRSKVCIPLDMFNKWVFLANQVKTEWIAYLKGHKREDQDEYEITEMYFPKQRASQASCEAEEGEIQEGTIGAVHSHVGMKAFFSREDEMHFNHQVELVVNNKGEIHGSGRTKLECGRYHRGPMDIVFIKCGVELALMKELKDKISPDVTQFQVKGAYL